MEDLILSEGELKEEDRLSTIVKNITFEGLVAPREAIKKYPNGQIGLNPGFMGISNEEALDPLSYMHLRYPTKSFTANFVKREVIDLDIDFLDSLESDIPKGNYISSLFYVIL